MPADHGRHEVAEVIREIAAVVGTGGRAERREINTGWDEFEKTAWAWLEPDLGLVVSVVVNVA